jgi:hypothetical protein
MKSLTLILLNASKARGLVLSRQGLNEDGIKHCAMNVLYSLQHLGYTIPPQADAGWIGEAGLGPSYLDPGSGGPENDFTAHGNQRSEWDAGCRFDFHNLEHR